MASGFGAVFMAVMALLIGSNYQWVALPVQSLPHWLLCSMLAAHCELTLNRQCLQVSWRVVRRLI